MEKINTVFTVEIPSTDHATLPLIFRQSGPHRVWVDWGDGSERETYIDEAVVIATHEYAEPGIYQIEMFAVDEGTIEFMGFGDDEGYRNMLTEVVLGEDVTVVCEDAFANCENLEVVEFANGSVNIEPFAFSMCCSLMEVSLPEGVAILNDGVFFNCAGLKTVTMPESLVEIGDNAFYGCVQLKNINLSHVETVGYYAFHGCRKLSAIMLGRKVKIGAGAFESCSSVRNITLTSAAEIGEMAFGNCRSLSKFAIPAGVKSIGDMAFKNCSFLTEVKMNASKPPVLEGIDAFDGANNVKIVVPRGAKAAYEQATNWVVYADIIEEAE